MTTKTQYNFLKSLSKIIGSTPYNITQKEIAKKVKVTPAAVCMMLQKLEDLGLLIRKNNKIIIKHKDFK